MLACPPLIIPAPESLIEGKLDSESKPFWFNGKPNQVINPVVGAPAGGNDLQRHGLAQQRPPGR